MKKYLLLLSLCLPALSAIAQSPGISIGSGPIISFASLEHDYGTIPQGADGNCEFVYTNTGDQPLIISECQKSCGCTTPKCSQAPLLPGMSASVGVKYDTQRTGPFTKSVTITSNATNSPSVILRIKGEVLPPNPGLTRTPTIVNER